MGDPLSVLQVCSASQGTYGAVQSLMTLARAQRAGGNHVGFVTFKGMQFGAEVRAEGFPVTEVAVRAKIDPVAIAKMRRLILKNKYDIVHTHLSTSSVNGCLAARTARVPSVATVHGMSSKMSFAAATHLIAVSDEVRKHLIRQGVKPTRISVVYNGLPMDGLRPEALLARREFLIPETAVVLGTIARVTPGKGIDDGIRSLRVLVDRGLDAYYVVVGDGNSMEECRSLAASLGLESRIRFLAYRTDVDFCLSAMDLFLFPSHKEAMGIALIEAMRAGLPVVANRIGGIPEVVTEDCGILVPDRDPMAMAESAFHILTNTELKATMSVAAVVRAKGKFSDVAMESQTEKVYLSLIKR